MSGERIGRYTIDRSLARGGMAEVFLAKAEGPGGFQKSVVIKRILPDLAEDHRFVELFLNEARLAALLNHPNIVQVFDFGEDEGAYFIAMEYIQGESVRNALYHFRDDRAQFPIRAAAQIAAGICEGLHYAHELCDENGVSYNIIHRDVTPENILISSSGIPKIVDFGIAKASSNTSKTEAGTVKGKYAYMAPEQVRGQGADRRLDVYAVGVCLYEMLAGQKPFTGEALALLHAILEGKYPPLEELNAAVPKELADVVATAMAFDPAKRFADAHRMGDALEDWLRATGKRVSAVELAQLVAEISRGRKAGRRPDQSSGPKGVPGFPPEGVNADPAAKRAPSGLGPRATLQSFDAALEETTPTGVEEPPPSEGETQLRPVLQPAADDAPAELPARPVHGRIIGLGVAAGLATLVAGWMLWPQGASPPSAREAPPAPVVAAAPPSLPPPPPAPRVSAPPAAQPATLPHASIEVALPPPPPPAPVATPSPTPAARPTGSGHSSVRSPRRATGVGKGTLDVRVQPWAQVYLDGKDLGLTPLQPLAVLAGSHELRFVNKDLGKDEKRRVAVREGGRELVRVFW